jgi:hypothetical protein
MTELWMTAQLSTERETVKLRHHHVKEHNVRQGALNRGEALLTVLGFLDFKAGLLEHLTDHDPYRGVIIDDHYSWLLADRLAWFRHTQPSI